ncbi:MAG: 1-acyl-sn-glycerol-3-phosphate acyltransferase [Chitinophagales bacterium]
MIARIFMWFCRLYFVKTGWQLKGAIPYDLKKYIVIAAPHTSAWDIPIGAGARSILGLDIKFMAKKEVFRFPFEKFIRQIGGIPVDRSKHSNLVDTIADIYRTNNEFALAIAPEGTRAYVKKWKSGFYYIAKKADIPIICGALDYSKKEVVFKEPFYTQDKSWEETEAELMEWYKQFKGKHPEKGVY